LQLRLFAFEECGESRKASGKKLSAEDRTRTVLADLKHVSRIGLGFRSSRGDRMIGQMKRENARVLRQAGITLELTQDFDGRRG